MRFVLGAVVVIALVACRNPEAPEPLGARLSVFIPADSDRLGDDGSSLVLNYPDRLVVSDSAMWDFVWHDSFTYYPEPARPSVDFGTYLVLVAVGGPGGDVTVDSVVQFASGARAYVSEVHLCGPQQVSWVGFQFVRTPRVDVRAWQTQDKGYRCGPADAARARPSN